MQRQVAVRRTVFIRDIDQEVRWWTAGNACSAMDAPGGL